MLASAYSHIVPTANNFRKLAQGSLNCLQRKENAILQHISALRLERQKVPSKTQRCQVQVRALQSMAPTVDKTSVQKDWEKRGFSFGVFVDPPGRVWPDFTHQKDDLVMLYEGEIELTFDGKSVRPSVGEEVLIPARMLHTSENIGHKTNQWLYGYRK